MLGCVNDLDNIDIPRCARSVADNTTPGHAELRDKATAPMHTGSVTVAGEPKRLRLLDGIELSGLVEPKTDSEGAEHETPGIAKDALTQVENLSAKGLPACAKSSATIKDFS